VQSLRGYVPWEASTVVGLRIRTMNRMPKRGDHPAAAVMVQMARVSIQTRREGPPHCGRDDRAPGDRAVHGEQADLEGLSEGANCGRVKWLGSGRKERGAARSRMRV
jgi:hypothetical protein